MQTEAEEPKAAAEEPVAENTETKTEEPKTLSDSATKKFMDDFLFGKEDEPEPGPEPDPEPEPEAKAEPEAKDEPEPDPEPEAKDEPELKAKTEPEPEPEPEPVAKVEEPPTPKQEAIDYDKLSQSVAKAIKKSEPEAPKEPTPASPTMSAKAKRKLDNLSKMEELYPDQYKGVSQRYANFVQQESEYKAKWESEHPGETFDMDDAAHDRFYDKHDVTYDKDDYLEAVAERRAEQRTADVRQELDRHRREAEMQPKLKELRKDVRKQVVNDFKDDMETPVIGELVSQQATYAEEMVETIHRLFNGSAYDPANPLHANAERLAAMAEQSMQQQPADKQLDGQGRRFTPLNSFVSMTPEQQAQSWTLSADQVAQFAVGAIQSATANQVKAKTDELERYLAAKTGKSMPRAETKEASASKPRSPSSVSEPKVAPVDGNGQNSNKSAREKFISEFIG